MSAWVETASGNLLKASAVTGIAARPETTDEGSAWELCITTGGPFSPLCRGLTREQAKALRRQFAVSVEAHHSGLISIAHGVLTMGEL